jgi:FkbH-like protein
MYRNWLPECHDLNDRIATARSIEDSSCRLAAFKRLAHFDHDFSSTIRIDRHLQQLRKSQRNSVDQFQNVRLAVLSTSTTNHLTAGVRVAGIGRNLLIDIYEPPYGQVRQEVVDPSSGMHSFAPHAVLFAADPYSLFGVAPDPSENNGRAAQIVEAAVESLRIQWLKVREIFNAIVIQQLPFNPFFPLLGENEFRLPGSAFSLIRTFQERLRAAANDEGIDIIDLETWAQRQGLAAWHSPSLWHRSKQEIHPTIAPLYGDLVARILAARYGKAAKCLVLDLDNTVWGGVIGDDGMEGIVIGQGSATGEGYLSFQSYAKQLARRGIILAVCSKNDEAIARKPFVEHPDMVLRLDDIACFVANWEDKATNIRRIARELNIGMDSLVFADDNAFERELVRTETPDVRVPELPDDAAGFPQSLAEAGYFECISLTRDDMAKTDQYRANVQRQALLHQETDLAAYLGGLKMTMKYGPFDETGIGRITQLINKTNQFNLTTRRYAEPEIRKLLDDPKFITMQVRLADRLGDSGVISIIIGTLNEPDKTLSINTWLMSCRVLGRQVEYAALNVLVELARKRGVEAIIGEYIPTERNNMVKNHYAGLGFSPIINTDRAFLSSLKLSSFKPFSTYIEIQS